MLHYEITESWYNMLKKSKLHAQRNYGQLKSRDCSLPIFQKSSHLLPKNKNTKNMQNCGFSCCLIWVWNFCPIQMAEQRVQVFKENMVLGKIF
jgi:hypothetical protein